MKYFRLSLSFFLIALFWEVGSILSNSQLVPSFFKIVPQFWKIIFDTNTYFNLFYSFSLVFKAFVISFVIGFPVSILLFKFKILKDVILPIHEFIRYIPVPAFVPLCLVAFGIGDLTKVSLIFIGTYFQILFLLLTDLNTQPKEYEQAALTLGINKFKIIYEINIMASLSNIIDTLRVSFAWAWSYLLVAEVINAEAGIGYLVMQSYRVLNMERLISYLILIGLLGILIDFIFKLIRKQLCPWI